MCVGFRFGPGRECESLSDDSVREGSMRRAAPTETPVDTVDKRGPAHGSQDQRVRKNVVEAEPEVQLGLEFAPLSRAQLGIFKNLE